MKIPKIITKIPQEKTIILLESDKNYTIIHLSDGKRLMSGYSLKYYEDCTDKSIFVRVNRSIMINLSQVQEFNLKESALRLNNGREVTISRRRIKSFLA